MVASGRPEFRSAFANAFSSFRKKSLIAACGLGIFALALLTGCSSGGGSGGGGSTAPNPAPAVNITPQQATLAINQNLSFNVSVLNASSTAVSWQVNNVPGGNATIGTVNSSGTYSAPAGVPNPATVKVTAILQANSSAFAAASVTIVPPLSLSPSLTSLTTSQTLQMQASGPTINNSGVSWSVDNTPGGSSSLGIITSSGLYAPPASSGLHVITASTTVAPIMSATATVAVTAFSGTFSWRNDASLTGENRQELALTPVTITGGQFGKLFACPVDGDVYAQPLYFANANVTAGAIHHNIVYVATEHDSVYAFDADANPCQQIWQANFVNVLGGAVQGISTVPACQTITTTCASNDVSSTDIVPEIGITGTPVIDPASGTLYVVAATKENGVYVQRLHALDIGTGNEKFGGPVLIQASVAGSGDGNNGRGSVPFAPLIESQRPALLFSGGNVYIGYGPHDPGAPYHGWLLEYNGTTLVQLAALNTTPNGSGGGISAGGAAPAADSNGNIFAATGAGTFDIAITGAAFHNDFGSSAIRLTASSIANPANYFTPFNQIALDSDPADFGSSGTLLLPSSAGSLQHPTLALLGSQTGTLYLLDTANLGGYTPGGPDKAVQEVALPGAIYGTPAFWPGAATNTIYTAASSDALKAFSVTTAALATSPSSQSSETFGFPGASPATSSNGTSGGIIWLVDTSAYGANGAVPSSAILHAYDVTNLSNELYNSSLIGSDAAGLAVKLAVPTVANGKVYVGTQNELSVYGLFQ